MTNTLIRTYPANLNIDSEAAHQSAPMVPSFSNRDDDFDSKTSFYPGYGDTGTQFTTNTTYSQLRANYVASSGGVWNGNQSAGFIIQKTSEQMVEFNLRFYSSPGHFIPATMVKGFSFLEYYATAFNSNWRTRRLALEFKNWNTDESRFYAPSWDNAKQATIKTQFRNMSSQTHWNVIRSWGPEWVFYGAIFNIRSESTSAVQSPKMHLYSARVAWQTTGLTGTNLWIPTKYQNWVDFRTQMKEGKPLFQTE